MNLMPLKGEQAGTEEPTARKGGRCVSHGGWAPARMPHGYRVKKTETEPLHFPVKERREQKAKYMEGFVLVSSDA